MKRLFWVGVGVGVTVLAIRKYRELSQRYSPPAVVGRAAEGLGERAADLGGRLRAGAAGFTDDLREARERREEQLRRALLSEGQTAPEQARARQAAGGLGLGSPRPRPEPRPERDAPDDALPYSF